MSDWPAPPAPLLEGARVRLEPLSDAHREGLHAAAADPRTWTWLLAPSPAADPAVLDAWLDAALAAAAAGTEGPFATIDAADGRVLGSTRFMTLRPEHRGLEIGWTWLHPDAWGTGVNVEAKLLQLAHAFETLGCLRVELKTHARNDRSRRAMERMGATYEGTFRKYQVTPGIGPGVRDSAFYSVIDDDWPAVRDDLRSRLR